MSCAKAYRDSTPIATQAQELIKLLKKWFRTEGESSDAGIKTDSQAQSPADSPDTAFDWRTLDSSSSGIFDSPDTHRIRVLQSEPVRPANDDDNPGYDPYDTGSFDVGNKG